MRTKKVSEILRIAILNRHNILLVSKPGEGKSDLCTQAVDRLEKEFQSGQTSIPIWVGNPDGKIRLMIVHAVVADPTDPKGLPWVIVKEGNAKAIFIPFGDLEQMMDTKDLLVVLLDDFGQAPPLVQAGYMQLVLARTINGHHIANGVTFIACTNRREDSAGVQGILEPVKSRFRIVNVESHWQDWCEWATLTNRIRPEVIAYHRWCGTSDKDKNHLSNFRPTKDMVNSPCPRTWEDVSKDLDASYPQDTLREMFIGSIGEEEGNAFYTFLSQWRDLVHPDIILTSPETADIPSSPSVLWSVLTALVERVNQKNFIAISKYAHRLAPEWSTYLIGDCVRKHTELKKTKFYIEWALKFGEAQI